MLVNLSIEFVKQSLAKKKGAVDNSAGYALTRLSLTVEVKLLLCSEEIRQESNREKEVCVLMLELFKVEHLI